MHTYDIISPASEYNGVMLNPGALPGTVNKQNNLSL